MSLIRFRATGNTTVPVSIEAPLPVALISGGGGASDVTIVGVQNGVVFNTTIGGVGSGVTVPVTGRVRTETVSQLATFASGGMGTLITVSGENLHDFCACIIHYQLVNTYTVRLHGSFTNAQEMVVAEATDITGRGFIVLPTFHVPNLRVEFSRTSGLIGGQTNRVFIVLTPNMPM